MHGEDLWSCFHGRGQKSMLLLIGDKFQTSENASVKMPSWTRSLLGMRSTATPIITFLPVFSYFQSAMPTCHRER
ncbi:hypothetical protein AMECASPLE_019128 [Ameca splendens]|uniref:Uncharacterized protein n=1 Tax=Ameca splendens TaxID=208324 RepID=A0ABV0XFZ1_9TELE